MKYLFRNIKRVICKIQNIVERIKKSKNSSFRRTYICNINEEKTSKLPRAKEIQMFKSEAHT